MRFATKTAAAIAIVTGIFRLSMSHLSIFPTKWDAMRSKDKDGTVE